MGMQHPPSGAHMNAVGGMTPLGQAPGLAFSTAQSFGPQPTLLQVRPSGLQGAPGAILMQQPQPQLAPMQAARPQQPSPVPVGGVGLPVGTPGSNIMLSAPINQGQSAGGALTIRPTVLQYPLQQPPPPAQPQQQQQQLMQQPGAHMAQGLRTVVLGQQQQPQQQQPQLVMQPTGAMQLAGTVFQGQHQGGLAPGQAPAAGAPSAAGSGPRPMKRQAYTPLPAPPQKRPMVRARQWPQEQQQPQAGSLQQQQHGPDAGNTAQGAGEHPGDGAQPGAAPDAGAAAATDQFKSSSAPRPGGGRGPVHVLADAQALMYAIMNHLAQLNAKQPKGRECCYDLCRFKSDFMETFR